MQKHQTQTCSKDYKHNFRLMHFQLTKNAPKNDDYYHLYCVYRIVLHEEEYISILYSKRADNRCSVICHQCHRHTLECFCRHIYDGPCDCVPVSGQPCNQHICMWKPQEQSLFVFGFFCQCHNTNVSHVRDFQRQPESTTDCGVER